MAEAVGYAPVPGPGDRETFFDAQARNQGAARRFGALAAVASAATGLPLAPFVAAVGIVVADVVNLVRPVEDPVEWGRRVLSGAWPPGRAFVTYLLAALVPGAVVLVLAWAGVRRIQRRADAGVTILALGARPPRAGVLEEVQVGNVVEELAVAARIEPPAVLILDSPVANAAAVGSGIGNCAVVVTTGLLAELDRDETQGVLAQVVASVGNGDLRAGLSLVSLFQATGLVATVLGAPGSAADRRLLGRALRAAVGGGRGDDAGLVAELLTVEGNRNDRYAVRSGVLRLPFKVTAAAFTTIAGFVSLLLVVPVLRRAWMARRYRADAAAVHLTRNPDAVAAGLRKLGGYVPGTAWTAHLFAGGDADPETNGTTMRSYQPKLGDRLDRLRAMGADGRAAAPDPARTPLAVVVFILTPLWAVLIPFFALVAAMYATLALLIDAIYFGPVVALLHVALRALAGG